jgi:phosphomannomutase
MYSSYFNGWIGKLDEFWTKEQRLKLFSSLFSYFQKQIHSGQKLFIGYDHHQSSKYMAKEAADFFSQNGIPVFISNRPLTTSMIQVITKERYGCGSLSFVCDDYSFPYVGLKASNMEGIFINKNDLNLVGEFKKQKKQPVDWFDPVLNLKNYLEVNFDFSTTGKAMNSLVWNAMHSPLSPILEEIFVDVFNKKSIDAYTINSYENTLTKDVITDFEIQEQIDLTSLKMSEYLCQYGVTTSPDLSKFDVLVEKNSKIQPVSFEKIITRIVPYLKHKEKIIISNEVSLLKLQDIGLEIIKVPDKEFFKVIKNEPFSIAIDGNYNIYLQSELFPNPFATLFCLYHSLIYIPDKKKSQNKKLDNKEFENTKI